MPQQDYCLIFDNNNDVKLCYPLEWVNEVFQMFLRYYSSPVIFVDHLFVEKLFSQQSYSAQRAWKNFDEQIIIDFDTWTFIQASAPYWWWQQEEEQ